jgi:hypothetical protein
MTIEELRQAIEQYPRCLYEALEAVDKAEKAVEKFNDQIDEELANLSPEAEPEADSSQSAIEREQALLQLDHELALLELAYEQMKGEVELAYRRDPPAKDKVTEATVAAYVKSYPKLVEAKTRCLDKEHERKALNISRRVDFAARRTETPREQVTSPKLERLQEKRDIAEISLLGAQMRVEEVKASILPYQLLVQLYTAGLVK